MDLKKQEGLNSSDFAWHDSCSPVRENSVLIEDNDEFSRAALAHLISIKFPKFSVVATDDSYMRSELSGDNHFDLIIIDTKNPWTDIRSIAESVLSVCKNTKLIFITGSSREKSFSYEGNQVYVFNKPIDVDLLFSTINEIMPSC